MRKRKQKQPKLRACPFCGSDKARTFKAPAGNWISYCTQCKGAGPSIPCQTKTESQFLWNGRVIRQDDLPDEVKELIQFDQACQNLDFAKTKYFKSWADL